VVGKSAGWRHIDTKKGDKREGHGERHVMRLGKILSISRV